MARIRTLDFLPSVFQTPTNSQFLGATLDQLVNPPVTKKIEGYVGSKFGNGVNAKDYYVTEPTKTRTNYQLDPGVVFTKRNETTAKDFLSYPGFIDALKLQNGIVDNNDRLFESQFYSWDSFADLDKIINYNQYYWLPEGLPSVVISRETVYKNNNFVVEASGAAYNIRALTSNSGSLNPTITLIRGGTYNFIVDQTTKFYIQTLPGTSGVDPLFPNISTREVYGVSNNGEDVGTVTFQVPFKNAQDQDVKPGNNTVSLITTKNWKEINGAKLSEIGGNIDGITSLDGLTLMFYLGDPNEVANLGAYAAGSYDQNIGLEISFDDNASNLITSRTSNFYKIFYLFNIDDPTDPIIQLRPDIPIPIEQKITAQLGNQYGGKNFYKSGTTGNIIEIPLITAPLDTLYYQDDTIESRQGVIRLIESNTTNTLNVETEILGQKNFSILNPSGQTVVFTNGLKVSFDGDILPKNYLQGEYYVQGVGTAIELIPVQNFIVPENYTIATAIPFDSTNYDIGNYDSTLFIPNLPDYITIARNSINRNAWSRSNRWFHSSVINATATYNNDPNIITIYGAAENKAKRPIIEFYPNLKLFNSGSAGKDAIDFFDDRTTDALTYVAGQDTYYPDVQTYTKYTGTLNASPTNIDPADFLIGQKYQISTLGNTDWNTVAQTTDTSPNNFIVGVDYIITDVGTTTDWNDIAGTTGLIYVNGDIITCKLQGSGNGLANVVYKIGDILVAKTDIIVGTTGKATAVSYTTAEIQLSDIVSNDKFFVGQYITDLKLNGPSQLPLDARILSITGINTLQLTIFSTTEFNIPSNSTSVSFIGNETINDNFVLFPGARIVFSADENVVVRNKIFVVSYSNVSGIDYPVIILSEAVDGIILPDEQVLSTRGFNNFGKTFWYNGINYIEAQLKLDINQPPLFDIFDKDGFSLSDFSRYQGSSFNGCTLFQYGRGAGTDDPVLKFPIRYSSINNVGDISFDVTYNSDTFSYVTSTTPETSNVNIGYVHNFTTRIEKNRLLGWQTAVAPSRQYQLFEFKYFASIPPIEVTTGSNFEFECICDVAASNITETIWPPIKVYNNNKLLVEGTDYTVVVDQTKTIVTLFFTIDVDTVIQIAILSDQVSKQAYYSIPINLSNNPFNTDLTKVNVGDIRGQYQTIFESNPNISGVMFGSNNYQDLGNMVPWGTKIIQNSASLVLPGVFLRNQKHNLFEALTFNSREYIKFKALLVDTVNNSNYTQRFDPAYMLDDAIDQISSTKNEEQSFFWSDMLPNKSAYITNTYVFRNALDTSTFALSKIYNFETANYNSVLIYINRTINGINFNQQLIKNIDYIISKDSPSVVVTYDLVPGDRVIIKEYNQTYGSYVPNTPTKLGLYPATIPSVFLDESFLQPTYFIIGHDGSFNKLYGDYNAELGLLVDFRDQVLLEFEKRIYNNLKLSAEIPIPIADVTPGFFRETPFNYDEWLEMYSYNFLDWIGQNRLNYKEQFFTVADKFSYNYRKSTNKIDNGVIQQGYFRGLNQYFYDVSIPDQTPWAMIGYTNKPNWWEDRYGPAPYTKDNLVLWGDLEEGIDWNNGVPIIKEQYKRPGLLNIIPTLSNGDLGNPLDNIIANYNSVLFRSDWKIGDVGPVELSYRRSSTFPFDMMKLYALMKPADFFNLAVDLDNYKYNPEFNQYLVNDINHLIISDIEIYGNGIPKTSYINWIVDYEKQLGVNATDNIKNLLVDLDVRLVYRLAGFSDKTALKFFVEKGTLTSTNQSLLIPDESYSLMLYENQPYDKLVYSSVLVQITQTGFLVFGNSQSTSYFKVLKPKVNGDTFTTRVENLEVQTYNEYTEIIEVVPYGTMFNTVQQVSQFIMNYGKYLESQGAIFDYQEGPVEATWQQMVAEFLYWAQMGWEVGSITTINPAASQLKINKESQIVQPLTIRQTNFILNQNLYPIEIKDLAIARNGTEFVVRPMNTGDTVAYSQFNLSNFEHGIVFDNTTLFNDVIYNLTTGLRQSRISLRGTKSAEWDGTVFASGFIYNQDNIEDWRKDIVYTKGQIVKYKNKYWTATVIIQPSNEFNQRFWKETDYDQIQKGLLPNSSTRSYESTLYYDTNKTNLELDSDQLSYSLIGYRPRDYLALADLTDITQINVYKNLIKNKGTPNILSAFKGANLPQGGIDYNFYENWAILSGEFGGILNKNFAEFRLKESQLTGNPSIVALTNGTNQEGAQQLSYLSSIFNYARPITDPNILETLTVKPTNTLFPDAGYVNYNDVKMAAFYYSQLSAAVNKNGIIVPISDFYVRDYVWLANYKGSWNVFTPVSIGQVIQVRGNPNNTCTVNFNKNHNLKKYEIFAIVNFDSSVNGYYIASEIISPTQVLIQLNLSGTNRVITGLGIGLSFTSQRVENPADIQTLPLLNSEFTKNTVWVDENYNGDWAVYRKNINYQYDKEWTKTASETFGSAVAYDSKAEYLISDASLGNVYRYRYNILSEQYYIDQTLTGDTSFGTAIDHKQNIYAISEPTSAEPKIEIFTINNTTVSDDMIPYQTILAPTGAINFGSSLSLSVDTNWLYVSDYNSEVSARNKVHVYRKRNELLNASDCVATNTYQITSLGEIINATDIIIGVEYEIVSQGTTNFTLIGAPNNDVGTKFIATGLATGTGTVYDNPTNFVNIGAITNKVGIYFKASGPALVGTTGTVTRCDYELVNTIDNGTDVNYFGHSVSTNIDGTVLVIGAPNTDYSVEIDNWGKTYVYSRLVQNIKTTTNSTLSPTVFTLSFTPDSIESLFVYKNGILIQPTEYTISTNTLIYSGSFIVGDIIQVSSNEFALQQILETTDDIRIGEQFGYSVNINNNGNEIISGAPFALSSKNEEGAVYRYTNGGAKYGIVTGIEDCNLTSTKTLLINGYAVSLFPSAAAGLANQIKNAKITNVTASSQGEKLIISIIDENLAVKNAKLILTSPDSTIWSELGITPFTETQIIKCPHLTGPTQFGTTVKFNEFESIVISAPVGQRYSLTTFDFSDNENLDDDTVFDNNATQFLETYNNAGAVYMFDLLKTYNESINNPSQFVYAQSINAKNEIYGSQPKYGTSLEFNQNIVMVGTPGFRPDAIDGQVITYINETGIADWTVYREPCATVDINKIQNAQIFDSLTNNTLINLDYFDPLQGKLLGAIRQNLDVISNIDPAGYNNISTAQSLVWGANKVGTLWFDTSTTKFLNYHQNDVVYNSKYWGAVFPGSNVTVYSWVSSNVPPSQYTGPGTVKSPGLYSVQTIINATNTVSPVYFFWVRNSNIVFSQIGKTLADSVLEQYISNPLLTGISYFAPLLPNTFGLYNCSSFINADTSVLHIGYSQGNNDDPGHTEYNLIRSNFADDFLPGLPHESADGQPFSLYDKMLRSLSGVNGDGVVLPNPFLPKAVQSGVLARPAQSFVYDRLTALKNYIQYANAIMKQYPIVELKPNTSFLFLEGPNFDVKLYWDFVNWWAPGYNDNTKAAYQVPLYSDLLTLNVPIGTIILVTNNGNNSETYRYDETNNWIRIGLTNGTISFNFKLYDYAEAGTGWGDNFFDTDVYDLYPSTETYWIIRAINEQIFTNELLIERNRSLILLFEYIVSETVESQNYLPWLNKTSLIDVFHKIRELKPFTNFQTDNQIFLEGYFNEAKPYHVVIKDFTFSYTGEDVFEGDITDFDLPAQYNTDVNQFITPELVYSQPNGDTQYLPGDPIWNNNEYKQWYNNYGVSLTGQNNFNISTIDSYVTLNSPIIFVKNVSGFPVNGTIKIDNELINYNNVDRENNYISELQRGVNGTEISVHIPGTPIYIDLPAVVILDSGKNYSEPPVVTAFIDTTVYPAPRTEAILRPIMSLDTVLGVEVVDPGSGYAVLPEIIIEPSEIIEFAGSDVNNITNTIQTFTSTLQTGNLVRYIEAPGSNGIINLQNGSWYYVGVLDTYPVYVIALYYTYRDSLEDNNRVPIKSNNSTTGYRLNIGAKASAVSSSYPIRENNITIKFDRTTYNSQIIDWEPGGFYGSFMAGEYIVQNTLASSSNLLTSTNPNINNILASSQASVFPIVKVEEFTENLWSGFERSINSITSNIIKLNVDILNKENASGSTIGFTIGMPIKFIGAVGSSTIVEDTTYYVAEIINDTEFTISNTPNGSVKVLNNYIPATTLSCFTAQIESELILDIDYTGIRTATQTFANGNYLRINLNEIGLEGTRGLYRNVPLLLTAKDTNAFGNLRLNETYFITTVIDNELVTISTEPDPIVKNVISCGPGEGPYGATWLVVVNNISNLQVGDPIIFTEMTVAGVNVSSFGNIEQGVVYYIRSITNPNLIELSTSPLGSGFNTGIINPADNTGCIFVDQRKVVQLTDGEGSLNVYVASPVSPGQINGQEFTVYPTSQQFVDLVGLNGNLIQTSLNAALSTINGIAIEDGVDNFYVNMPFNIDKDFGGLSEFVSPGVLKNYYVSSIGQCVVSCYATTATNLVLTLDTSMLYDNMPIIFTGVEVGGIELGAEYFVKPGSIVLNSHFKISYVKDGEEVDLTLANGPFTGTGPNFIRVTESVGGPVVPLNDDLDVATLTQKILTQSIFDVSYILGGYRVIITDPGQGYAVDNTITIRGNVLGGTTKNNSLTIIVTGVDAFGAITSVITEGRPAGQIQKFYFKVTDTSKVQVFLNPLMTVPAKLSDFPYTGYTSTYVTNITNNTITLNSLDGFELNDTIIFTGELSSFNDISIDSGTPYYILSIAGNEITLTTDPGSGIEFDITIGNYDFAENSLVATKPGSFAFLPEPFNFNQSIVKYNNRVWECILSNNDDTFVLGKWSEMRSDDIRLNAMDRAVGYYAPTDSMPGLDLTQLFTGVTYPNSTYLGNAFDPNKQFTLDTILQDEPFYPTGIDMTGIIYDGSKYLIPANMPNYSGFVTDETGNNWELAQLANKPLGLTDIIYSAGMYIMTSTNPATPIFRSNNGINWTTNGYFTPYGATPYDDEPYDMTSLDVASLSLQSVAYQKLLYDVFVAVGENIVTSTDSFKWVETYQGATGETYYAVTAVDIPNFKGFVAVGKGTNTYIILTSTDGVVWNKITGTSSAGFYSVMATDNIIVIGGENGIIYVSTDGVTFTQATGISTTSIVKEIIYVAPYFMAVGEDGLVAKTNDPTGVWDIKVSGTARTLNSINFANFSTTLTAVGDDNTIITSEDYGETWTGAPQFNVLPPAYKVQGGLFAQGYAPEELVAGIVYDQLAMTVTTRPGTNWPATTYAGVGYMVVSLELASEIDNVYSFADAALTPQQIAVFIIDEVTNLSTRLYEGIDYTVDWINYNVTLNNPITDDKLRIDVYEAGNGNQLVKADTGTDPLRTNTITGFNEIYVNCNYSSNMYEGGGLVRTDTGATNILVLSTSGDTDSIVCETVKDLTLNGQIVFQGNIYGGLNEDPIPYYIKSISPDTNSITISATITDGVAGPIYPLVNGPDTDQGPMFIVVQSGLQNVYTTPLVYHNGIKLIYGKTTQVTRTKASSNTLTCLTTNGLAVGDKITFDKNIFGGLEPLQTYYIQSIVDGNEFTISLTEGGSIVPVTNAFGVSTFITNDYAIAQQPSGINAKLIFAAQYSNDDYLTYTLLGESQPEQYGYTIPEIQVFAGNGTTGPYELTNYIGDDNTVNAIVEINGLRIDPSKVVLNKVNNTLTFIGLTPSSNDNVAVTSYNDTARQYLFTKEITIDNNTTISKIDIAGINTSVAPPADIVTVSETSVIGNIITCNRTQNFVEDMTIVFRSLNAEPFGNIFCNGKVYFIDQVLSPTTFTIKDEFGIVVPMINVTGLIQAIVGGQPAIRITTSNTNTFETNDLIRIAGLNNYIQLNDKQFYIHVITETQFDLYEYFASDPSLNYNPNLGATNYPVTEASNYTADPLTGYVWLSGSFILQNTVATSTKSSNKSITVNSTNGLISNTPVYFTENNCETGDVMNLGGLICGKEYYIKDVGPVNDDEGNPILAINEITVSETRDGNAFTVTNSSGNATITQWSQDNVDRLYVTIDGARVPSSNLQIYNQNELAILHELNVGQKLVYTFMMPNATPNEEVYVNYVNEKGEGSVYRSNTNTRTWLTTDLVDLSGTIYVKNLSRLTNIITQNAEVTIPIDNHYYFGLTADKNEILEVKVYNNNPERQGFIQEQYIEVKIIDTAPQLEIVNRPSVIQPGDILTITTVTGKYIIINGEEIQMFEVDLANNTIVSFQRGSNGTIVNNYLPKYTEVYSKLEFNRMSDINYNRTWNSYNYNQEEGDPLQLSTTPAANFLNLDIT